jgi:hypothetical protein
VFSIVFACWTVSNMSKSIAETEEIDAIAWLLITTSPQDPTTYFKKAGQMAGSDSTGRHYRHRLLESLRPLLTLFITSHHAPEHPSSGSDNHSLPSNLPVSPHLEYMGACLARLSEFTDCKGSACYQLDKEGSPVMSPATVVWIVATVLRSASSDVATALKSAATLILNISHGALNRQEEQGDPNLHRPVERLVATRLELPYSSGQRQPEIGDSGMC